MSGQRDDDATISLAECVLAGDAELSRHGVQCSPGIPRLVAALLTPPAFRGELGRCVRSTCSSVLSDADSGASCRMSDREARRLRPRERMTGLSMKFSSSRTLPGRRQRAGERATRLRGSAAVKLLASQARCRLSRKFATSAQRRSCVCTELSTRRNLSSEGLDTKTVPPV